MATSLKDLSLRLDEINRGCQGEADKREKEIDSYYNAFGKELDKYPIGMPVRRRR